MAGITQIHRHRQTDWHRTSRRLRTRRALWATFALATLATAMAPWAQAQVSIQARLDTDSPYVGDEVHYILVINAGGQALDSAPRYPDFEGFERAGAPMEQTRSSFSNINGRMSSVTTYQYTLPLVVQREGALRIAPTTVRIGGTEHASNPVEVTSRTPSTEGLPETLAREGIVPARAPGDNRLSEYLRDKIFLRPVISNLNPYLREQVVVSYYLYIDTELYQQRMLQSFRQRPWEPDSTALFESRIVDAGASGGQLSATSEVIDGREYYRALLLQTVLLPLRQGQTELPMFRARADVGVRFNTTAIQLNTRSFPLSIRPLPSEGRPADFSGAVGDFTITASINQSVVKEYDVAELRLVIEGTGNVATIAEPNLDPMDGIEVFSSDGETETEMRDGKFGGRKVFNIVLQPSQPGILTIPPVGFNFFNPQTAQYQTIQANPLTLHVEEDPDRQAGVLVVDSATARNGQNGAPQPRAMRAMTEIYSIHNTPDMAFVPTRPFHAQGSFWALQLAPLALLGAATWTGGRRRRLATDTAFARSARARERASKRLKGAAEALRREDHEGFYAEIALALRGLVADRCGLATAGATNQELRQAAAARSGDTPLADRLYEYLELCDAARYAPGSAPAGTEKWEDISKLVKQLEKKLK